MCSVSPECFVIWEIKIAIKDSEAHIKKTQETTWRGPHRPKMRQYIPPGRGTKYHLWSGFEKKKRKKKAIRSRSSLSIYQCIGYKAEHNVKQYNRKASSKIQTMGNSRTYNHLTTLLKKYFKREREKKWGGGQMEGRPIDRSTRDEDPTFNLPQSEYQYSFCMLSSTSNENEMLKICILLTTCLFLLGHLYITHRSSMSSRIEATVGPDPRWV